MLRRGTPTDPADLVARAIRRYRRRHRSYERLHPEIFNPVEQARLRAELQRAAGELAGDPCARPVALDLGCGSGNVTRHLLDLGMEVIAADVSPEFLADVERRFGPTGRVTTLQVSGLDLAPLPDRSVDMVCAYSVLHHIPDYVAAVSEMCRVTRPGGIVYLDHEANDDFYDRDGCFWEMLGELQRRRRDRDGWWNPVRSPWQRVLQPSTYVERARRLLNPAHPWDVEGDIHVWEHDRVQWSLVEERLLEAGCEVVRREDYLNYSAEYPDDVWRRFEGRCTNMRLMVARVAGDRRHGTTPRP